MKCSLLTLSAYVDAELDAGHRGELEAHLVGCDRCRDGIDWLRDETERVAALARVHVPDHSVHALFEQLGLTGPTDPLPPRSFDDGPVPVVADVSPWMTGDHGKALPWAAVRPMAASSPGTVPPTHPAAAERTGAPALPGQDQFSFREPSGGSSGVQSGNADDDRPSPAASGGEIHVTPQQHWIEDDLPEISTNEHAAAAATELQQDVDFPPGHRIHAAAGPVRAAGPVPAPATPFSRLRERLELRRALGRRNDRAFDDSVLVVSGRGAPLGSARTRVRSEREATRQRNGASVSDPLGPDAQPPVHAATPPQTVPPQTDRVGALRDRLGARRRITATLAGAGAVSRQARLGRGDGRGDGPARAAGRVSDRRPLAVFGGVAAMLMLVGVLAGRSVSPLPAAQQHAAAPPVAAAAPQGTAKNASAPSPTASTSEVQVSNAVVVGTGGAGYTVSLIRYGIHPGDFRIVIDMTAAATAHGTPQATVGILGGNRLRVQIAGVSGSQNVGQVPSTTPVTGVALVQSRSLPGAAVYDFTLSRAVTLSAYWVSAPLRLVIDLH